MQSTALRQRRLLAKINTRHLTTMFDERVKFLLDKRQYGVPCTFLMPPRREQCSNCIPLKTGASSGAYRDDGPVPFPKGEVCPVCRGKGGWDLNAREEGILIVLFDFKQGLTDFLRPGGTSEMPEGTCMIIGERSKTWELFTKCNSMILNTDVYGDGAPYYRKNEAVPLGLFNAGQQGRSRWFFGYADRDGGS